MTPIERSSIMNVAVNSQKLRSLIKFMSYKKEYDQL